MRSKNNYLLLTSVVITVALLIYIMMDQSDRSLAILGGLTAFASVVLTALINIDRNKLDREKIEADLISNVTKEAYKEMFNQKIEVYRKMLGLIRDYRNEAASYMCEIYMDDLEGYPQAFVNPHETVFTMHLQKLLEFMKTNEIILSKKLYGHYEEINKIYNEITADSQAWQHEVAAGDPDEQEYGRSVWKKSIYNKTKDMFDGLASDLDEEVDKIREKISF